MGGGGGNQSILSIPSYGDPSQMNKTAKESEEKHLKYP